MLPTARPRSFPAECDVIIEVGDFTIEDRHVEEVDVLRPTQDMF